MGAVGKRVLRLRARALTSASYAPLRAPTRSTTFSASSMLPSVTCRSSSRSDSSSVAWPASVTRMRSSAAIVTAEQTRQRHVLRHYARDHAAHAGADHHRSALRDTLLGWDRQNVEGLRAKRERRPQRLSVAPRGRRAACGTSDVNAQSYPGINCQHSDFRALCVK